VRIHGTEVFVYGEQHADGSSTVSLVVDTKMPYRYELLEFSGGDTGAHMAASVQRLSDILRLIAAQAVRSVTGDIASAVSAAIHAHTLPVMLHTPVSPHTGTDTSDSDTRIDTSDTSGVSTKLPTNYEFTEPLDDLPTITAEQQKITDALLATVGSGSRDPSTDTVQLLVKFDHAVLEHRVSLALKSRFAKVLTPIGDTKFLNGALLDRRHFFLTDDYAASVTVYCRAEDTPSFYAVLTIGPYTLSNYPSMLVEVGSGSNVDALTLQQGAHKTAGHISDNICTIIKDEFSRFVSSGRT